MIDKIAVADSNSNITVVDAATVEITVPATVTYTITVASDGSVSIA